MYTDFNHAFFTARTTITTHMSDVCIDYNHD